MNDRELLEQAASVYGLKDAVYHGPIEGCWSEELDDFWNPLTDNGDAFQLAAAIGAEIRTYCVPMYIEDKAYVTVTLQHWNSVTGEIIRLSSSSDFDPGDQLKVVRYVIVKIAAELGERLNAN